MNTVKRILGACNHTVADAVRVITSAVEKRKITAALVVVRRDGAVMITVSADLELQAEGTWNASALARRDFLKITRAS